MERRDVRDESVCGGSDEPDGLVRIVQTDAYPRKERNRDSPTNLRRR